MCRLRNIALESVTDGRTDDGQSDPYVSLCFAGDTKKPCVTFWRHNCEIFNQRKVKVNVKVTAWYCWIDHVTWIMYASYDTLYICDSCLSFFNCHIN